MEYRNCREIPIHVSQSWINHRVAPSLGIQIETRSFFIIPNMPPIHLPPAVLSHRIKTDCFYPPRALFVVQYNLRLGKCTLCPTAIDTSLCQCSWSISDRRSIASIQHCWSNPNMLSKLEDFVFAKMQFNPSCRLGGKRCRGTLAEASITMPASLPPAFWCISDG